MEFVFPFRWKLVPFFFFVFGPALFEICFMVFLLFNFYFLSSVFGVRISGLISLCLKNRVCCV